MCRQRSALHACVAAGLLLATGAAEISAQRAPSPASPFLSSDHWSVAAARRLSALDLADRDFGWGDGSLTIVAVGRTLYDAATLAREKNAALAPLAAGYWARFASEFSATARSIELQSHTNAPRAEGWISLAYSTASGRVYPVRSLDRSRENVAGPFPRPALSEVDVLPNVNLGVGSHIAASLAPERRDGRWSIHEGYVLASAGKLGLWGGRRAPEFSTGAGGGLILTGTASFTGGGVVLTEPLRLPWLLRHLGAIRFETFLSRIDSNATVRNPWVLGSHASISPHPRLLVGATQTFMFAGEGVGPFTWRNFKEMFRSHAINVLGSEFENGLASVEVRFRPPLPIVPLALYMEWGADDNHSAWTLFPGIVAGAHVPAVPGVPALSLGLERAYFAGPCRPDEVGCPNNYYATWYRHYVFMDGWTIDRQPIGHPLGGEGSEWLMYGAWDDPAERLRLDARAFLRDRGPYNIYAPARAGRSIGGAIAATYRAVPHLDLLFKSAIEKGRSDWEESSLSAGVRWIF